MERRILSVLVNNHPGVLMRVASLFSRRGYNINSLTVGVTGNPEISRMTISALADEDMIVQIKKQLLKLIDVLNVEELSSDNMTAGEIALVKVTDITENNQIVNEAINLFRARIMYVGSQSVILEATGDSEEIDRFVGYMSKAGLIEVVRTGIAALDCSDNVLTKKEGAN